MIVTWPNWEAIGNVTTDNDRYVYIHDNLCIYGGRYYRTIVTATMHNFQENCTARLFCMEMDTPFQRTLLQECYGSRDTCYYIVGQWEVRLESYLAEAVL